MGKKIIVIGAGINGLCLAEALNERGHEVMIFDKNTIPNPISPSYLDAQIVRPLYVENERLGLRIQPALSAWRELFHRLGENYFKPTGVIAISRREGDWADQALRVMRENQLPFRFVQGPILKDLLPALKFDNLRMGVLADLGGQMRGRDLMDRLHQYLIEAGVKFHPQEEVLKVDAKNAKIKTYSGEYSADWVVLTASHSTLTPEMGLDLEEFLGSYCDLRPPAEYRAYWRFAPVWVDLGREDNCWGIPRMDGDVLRVGAGVLSDKTNAIDSEIFSEMESLYSDIIRDFHEYKVQKFERVAYRGTRSGDFQLRRHEQAIGLSADSGHGFKFAAENAINLAVAIENDALTMAARQIAGV